jgi:hypothetical protein
VRGKRGETRSHLNNIPTQRLQQQGAKANSMQAISHHAERLCTHSAPIDIIQPTNLPRTSQKWPSN